MVHEIRLRKQAEGGDEDQDRRGVRPGSPSPDARPADRKQQHEREEREDVTVEEIAGKRHRDGESRHSQEIDREERAEVPRAPEPLQEGVHDLCHEHRRQRRAEEPYRSPDTRSPDRFLPVLEEVEPGDPNEVPDPPERKRLLRQFESQRSQAQRERGLVHGDPDVRREVHRVDGEREQRGRDGDERPAASRKLHRGPGEQRGQRQDRERAQEEDARPGALEEEQGGSAGRRRGGRRQGPPDTRVPEAQRQEGRGGRGERLSPGESSPAKSLDREGQDEHRRHEDRELADQESPARRDSGDREEAGTVRLDAARVAVAGGKDESQAGDVGHEAVAQVQEERVRPEQRRAEQGAGGAHSQHAAQPVEREQGHDRQDQGGPGQSREAEPEERRPQGAPDGLTDQDRLRPIGHDEPARLEHRAHGPRVDPVVEDRVFVPRRQRRQEQQPADADDRQVAQVLPPVRLHANFRLGRRVLGLAVPHLQGPRWPSRGRGGASARD